jgi:hypothetical protein
MKKSLIIFAILTNTIAVSAQKIDFDINGRNSNEVTASGYSSWMVAQQASDDKTFNNVNIKIETLTKGEQLHAQWNKEDVRSHQLKLTGDGITAAGIRFIISGLSTGQHTILAYHNGVNGLKKLIPISIYVNGQRVIEGVQQSENAQSIDDAALSYITVNAQEGKNIILEYRTDPLKGIIYSSNLVYINSLSIDQNNPQKQARQPYPDDQDFHAKTEEGSLTLSWAPAKHAAKHHILIGTSKNKISPVATITNCNYNLSHLSNLDTYYWQVNEEDSTGNITKGKIWTFRPRHLAFPGAEGYGKYAIGGRGGSVYHVINLADNGDDRNPIPGSFRYGIKKVSGPRTIVFDVAGTINLKNRLTCSDPYVTVAGQTAPGNGILLKTSPFGMASDGITRFIRMRLGHKKLVDGVIPGTRNKKSYGNEADTSDETTLNGEDGMGMAGNDNAIMDHCSISWTIDEAFSSRSAQSMTLQHTLISEALNIAGHPNYEAGKMHGYAATIGGGENSSTLKVGSYHHNLLANCEGRNWSISGGLDGTGAYDGHHDIYNNVVYNWGTRGTDGGSHEINFVNNFYKMGAATVQTHIFRLQLEGTGTGSQSAYVSGNIRQEKNNGKLTTDKEGDTYRYELTHGQKLTWIPFVSKPFFPSKGTIETAQAAYKNVLSDVGCNEPVLDVHDKRMIEETLDDTYHVTGSRSGMKGLPDSENDKGCEGYSRLQMTEVHRPANWDTDGDGMPNWWEQAKGLNPQKADNNTDPNHNGYTSLEEYLNYMAVPHFEGKIKKIDLKTFFAGYNHRPSFEIVNRKGNIEASIKNDILKIKSEKGLSSITIKVTDQDNWGTLVRTFNFYRN